jgi:hypothetical protein
MSTPTDWAWTVTFIFLLTWIAVGSCNVAVSQRRSEQTARVAAYTYAYENRWRRRGTSMRSGIRAFSAAVKPRASHPRPWLLELADTGRTRRLRQEGRDAYSRMLDLSRRWVDGEDIGTPCEGSVDYGGPMDGMDPRHEAVECEGGDPTLTGGPVTRNTFRKRRHNG